jgi:hypothetical protein
LLKYGSSRLYPEASKPPKISFALSLHRSNYSQKALAWFVYLSRAFE